MKLISNVEGDACRVHVSGRIEISDVRGLEEFLKQVARKEIRRFLIDLSQVYAIFSKAIGVLLAFSEQTKTAAEEVLLMNPNVKVLSILKRTGLNELFKIVDSA